MTAPILLPARHATLLNVTWLGIFLVALADVFWLHQLQWGFHLKTLGMIAGVSAMLLAVSLFYRRFRRDDALWLGAQVAAQLVAGSCAIATLSYAVAAMNHPLLDDAFIAFDRQVGFDWQAYAHWVNGHPYIAHLLTLSYLLTGPEVIGMLLVLAIFGEFTAFHRFAVAFLTGALITILMSGYCPALTEYIHRGIAPEAYPHLQVADASAYAKEFLAARSHTLGSVPAVLQGIVAFPSFHSAIAVFAMVGAWSIPYFSLRLIIILINVMMLLSTPVDGGHYLADTLAGIALAIVICALVPRLLPDGRSKEMRG